VRSVARDADRLFGTVEEFALLLSDTGLSGSCARAPDRRDGAPAASPGHDAAVVTCSVGVAELGASDDTWGAELVGRSDAALYAAKGAGRNRAIAYALAASGPGLPSTADETSTGRHAGRC
jgi:PleD family two-component response regulator